jgi:serine/threonine protein kinase
MGHLTAAAEAESAPAEAESASKAVSEEAPSGLPDIEGLDEEETLMAVVGAVASRATRAGVRSYLEALKPAEKSKEEAAAAAAAAAPVETEEGGLTVEAVRLERLKLQDLVFGRVLGSGAFSTVKWCKRIVPGLTQSAWPEFATKIISSETMARLGYERSVEREVAVLRRMTHPGVARLLASFRYGDGAYLVLEFGSRGDLHSHITGMGSLSLESARFALGEVVAGLSAVHQLGFAYGDLKPENILLTKSGHVKLTDFGGARPITDAAKAAVRAERHILRNLPDGAWNAAPADAAATVAAATSTGAETEDEESDETEQKLELTAVYMAPELVTGSNVSVASDCWALGCVLYFALAGRPPVWADGVAELMQTIVAFSIEAHFPDDFPEAARDLVTRLLAKDPADRVSEGPDPLAWVKEHPFFAPLGVPVSGLFAASPPELAKGTVAPQTDARWARRQYSMLIAPMPEQFDFVALSADSSPIPETDHEVGAPFTSQSAAKAAAAAALPVTGGVVFAVGPAASLSASDQTRLDFIDEDEFEDATDAVE